MTVRIAVREGETIELALKRLRTAVQKDRIADKWPKYRDRYAKPSEIRHRKQWIQAMRRKYQMVWERIHRTQMARVS